VLVAGCGGGEDHAKVEASLQDYLVSSAPEDAPFPVGAGTPRVRDNGCTDLHVKTEKGLVLSTRNLSVKGASPRPSNRRYSQGEAGTAGIHD
jgi:hypothetical protein